MNALEELLADSARKSSARFFLRCAQAGSSAKVYDEHSVPLFTLALILDAEGMLASEARHLVSDEAKYLRKCRDAIERISLDMGAN